MSVDSEKVIPDAPDLRGDAAIEHPPRSFNAGVDPAPPAQAAPLRLPSICGDAVLFENGSRLEPESASPAIELPEELGGLRVGVITSGKLPLLLASPLMLFVQCVIQRAHEPRPCHRRPGAGWRRVIGFVSMSNSSARCSNGHDVLGIEPGSPCPECGDTARHVTISVTDSAGIEVEESPAGLQLSGSGAVPLGGTASIELTASGTAVGRTVWTGRAEGEAPPVIDDVQEVLLRWTPLDDTSGTWMLEVHREGENIAVGVGDKFVRAIAQVVNDLYPNV